MNNMVKRITFITSTTVLMKQVLSLPVVSPTGIRGTHFIQ